MKLEKLFWKASKIQKLVEVPAVAVTSYGATLVGSAVLTDVFEQALDKMLPDNMPCKIMKEIVKNADDIGCGVLAVKAGMVGGKKAAESCDEIADKIYWSTDKETRNELNHSCLNNI